MNTSSAHAGNSVETDTRFVVEQAGLSVLSLAQDGDHATVVVGFQSRTETLTFKIDRCRFRGRATLRGRLVAIAQRLQAEGGAL